MFDDSEVQQELRGLQFCSLQRLVCAKFLKKLELAKDVNQIAVEFKNEIELLYLYFEKGIISSCPGSYMEANLPLNWEVHTSHQCSASHPF